MLPSHLMIALWRSCYRVLRCRLGELWWRAGTVCIMWWRTHGRLVWRLPGINRRHWREGTMALCLWLHWWLLIIRVCLGAWSLRIIASLSWILLKFNLSRRDVNSSCGRFQTRARSAGSVSMKSDAEHDKGDDEQDARHGLASNWTA
jgi:hypothetical protein